MPGLESLQDAGDGPDAGVAARAVLNRAYLLIEDGALEEGVTALEDFAERFPNHPRITEALQILAQTREALEDTEAAPRRLGTAVAGGGGNGLDRHAGCRRSGGRVDGRVAARG